MLRQLAKIDRYLTKRIYHKPKWLKPVMKMVSRLGRPIIIMLVCGLLALMLFIAGQPAIALGFGLCLVALSLGGLSKGLLKRERPASQYVSLMRIQSFSFPSGHSLGTFVLYGYIIALVGFFMPAFILVAVVLFGLLILLTGMSRVYLGAHYVSDVLGGWILAGVALFVIIKATL